MKKTILALLFFSSALVFAACNNASKDAVRWKFSEGVTHSYKYTHDSSIYFSAKISGLPADPMEEKYELASRGVIDFKPTPDGNAEVVAVIEAGDPRADAKNSKQILGAIARSIPVKMNRVSASIDTKGAMLSKDVQSDTYKMLKGLLDEMYQLPPNEVPRVGEKWKNKIEYSSADMDIVEGTIETTFVGWETNGAVKFAKFKSVIDLTASKKDGSAYMNMAVSGKGEWTFCPALGSLMDSIVDYELKLDGAVENLEEMFQVSQQIKVTFSGKGTAHTEARPEL